MNQKDIMMGVVALNSYVRYYVYDKSKTNLEQMYLDDRDTTMLAYKRQYLLFEEYFTDFGEDGVVDWFISLN
jgi:hypothetical protein